MGLGWTEARTREVELVPLYAPHGNHKGPITLLHGDPWLFQ